MAIDLPAGALEEKNKMETGSAWVVLFELQVSDVDRLYLVNSESDVVFDGATYRRFPIAFEQMEESLAGDLPVLNVTVSNVTREIQAFLEFNEGLLDRAVVIRVVSSALLADPTAAIAQRYTITATTSTELAVSFRLSQLPFFDLQVPHQTYSRTRCRFAFRSEECGWAFPSLPGGVADSTTCDKSRNGPNGCGVHGDLYTAGGEVSEWPQRWGGFSSIPRRRV